MALHGSNFEKIKILVKFYSILSLILFLSTNTSAQEKEYIVRNNNDTIYGKVKRGTNHLNPSKIIFKIKDEQGKKRLIKPNEVKIIRSLNGVDGDCVIKTIHDKFFIKKIIDGRIEVFQWIDNPIFYTSKDGGELKLADFGGFGSRKKSHSQIRSLIDDNPKILKEFDVLKGSVKNILNIIEKYNTNYKTTANN